MTPSQSAAPPDDVPAAPPVPSVAADPHTTFEDVQAIATAAAFIALGTAFLRHARLVTGGVTGAALLLARVIPFSFGQILVVANLPFLWLAVRRKGWKFTCKSFVAILLVSVASDHLDRFVRLDAVHPLFGALMGGALFGIGLLILFRHQASLGGLNVLALHLQERHGIRAGISQGILDAAIVVASLFAMPLATVGLSVVGALALNLVLAVNHKPGRYAGG